MCPACFNQRTNASASNGTAPSILAASRHLRPISSHSSSVYLLMFSVPQRYSTTPRGAPARVTLQTRAIAHQGEVSALAARFALVALGARLGAFLGGSRLGVRTRVGPGE